MLAVKKLSLLLILLLSLQLFTSCENEKDKVGLLEGKQGDFEKKLSYTMNILDIDYAGKGEDGETAVNFAWFCEKFNIEFTFWPVNWTDWSEKTRVWTYSGDMPDILFLDIAPARFTEYAMAARQGAYKALPEFGEKYPNLQKYKESLRSIQYLTIDGKLYTLPKSRDGEGFNNASYWAYIYRRDWAEKLGLANEDNIYTWDEWLELNKAFVDKDPGGNGSGKTVGMGAQKWALPKFMGGGCINPYFLTYAKVNGRYVWGPTMPQSLELVRTFKKMYDDGIIWDGMLIGKDMDSSSMYYAGLMGVMPYSIPVAGLDNFRYNFSKSNPEVKDLKKATEIALVRNLNGKIYAEQTEDFWSSFSFSSKLDDEKLDRILTAYDWMASEEGADFRNLGIPGVDWEVINGEKKIKWKANGDGTYKYPYPVNSEHWMGMVLKDGYNLKSPAFPEAMRNEIIGVQNRKLQEDCNLVPFDYDVMYFNGPEYSKAGTMEDEIVDKLCELLISSSDIESDWQQWLKKMEPRYKPVEEELNRVLNR